MKLGVEVTVGVSVAVWANPDVTDIKKDRTKKGFKNKARGKFCRGWVGDEVMVSADLRSFIQMETRQVYPRFFL
jgi:hypothetical protein